MKLIIINNPLDIANSFNQYFSNLGPELANNISYNSAKTNPTSYTFFFIIPIQFSLNQFLSMN